MGAALASGAESTDHSSSEEKTSCEQYWVFYNLSSCHNVSHINATNASNATILLQKQCKKLDHFLSENACPALHTEHAEGHGETPTIMMFIFSCCIVGALIRTFLKRVPLPYTVVLLFIGVIIGLIARISKSIEAYTEIAFMDPHLIFHVFLPVLIFESAFSLDIHTFGKVLFQVILLALPGLIVATSLTALLSKFIFSYGWSWAIAMIFGAIVSATDPVAVVALLKDLGASKTLAILIEGESLLNDGAAIVIFNVIIDIVSKGQSSPYYSVGGVALYFLRVSLGGPALGWVFGKLTTFWLSMIFNDAMTEITITLGAAYVTFYVGEVFFRVSGVLAVVMLGVVMSSEKTSISPEVEIFLHRFWEMLAYLANTLIFVLVGIVIARRIGDHMEPMDGFNFISCYIGVNIIRGLTIGLCGPLLMRMGYGFTWQNGVVMTWAGLRGAVGLTLALLLSNYPQLDKKTVSSKILFHTAGIVMMTLFLNATTIKWLLKKLGMSEVSTPKKMAMQTAVRYLIDCKSKAINILKSDRFLADADWELVENSCVITDPYHTGQTQDIEPEQSFYQRVSVCPDCETLVPNEPSPQEQREMENEAHLRYIKAQKSRELTLDTEISQTQSTGAIEENEQPRETRVRVEKDEGENTDTRGKKEFQTETKDTEKIKSNPSGDDDKESKAQSKESANKKKTETEDREKRSSGFGSQPGEKEEPKRQTSKLGSRISAANMLSRLDERDENRDVQRNQLRTGGGGLNYGKSSDVHESRRNKGSRTNTHLTGSVVSITKEKKSIHEKKSDSLTEWPTIKPWRKKQDRNNSATRENGNKDTAQKSLEHTVGITFYSPDSSVDKASASKRTGSSKVSNAKDVRTSVVKLRLTAENFDSDNQMKILDEKKSKTHQSRNDMLKFSQTKKMGRSFTTDTDGRQIERSPSSRIAGERDDSNLKRFTTVQLVESSTDVSSGTRNELIMVTSDMINAVSDQMDYPSTCRTRYKTHGKRVTRNASSTGSKKGSQNQDVIVGSKDSPLEQKLSVELEDGKKEIWDDNTIDSGSEQVVSVSPNHSIPLVWNNNNSLAMSRARQGRRRTSAFYAEASNVQARAVAVIGNKNENRRRSDDIDAIQEESRKRYLNACKVSYWKQFEHGMLSREAVSKLVECADVATDQRGGYMDLKEIKKTWQVKGLFPYLKQKLETWGLTHRGPQEAMPRNRFRRWCYIAANHIVFETIINIVILVNMIPILMEILDKNPSPGNQQFFDYSNYVFFAIYCQEAFVKVIAFGKHYFLSHWNQLDLLVIILSVVDIVISKVEDESQTFAIDPSFLKLARIFRLLRISRLLKLCRPLTPKILEFFNKQINKQLSFGYDVGKGYVSGEEEVNKLIDQMIDHKPIAQNLKEISEQGRLEVIRELAMLQREHPGIAVAVKTRQAIRSVLNTIMESLNDLKGDGLLDDVESLKLSQMIELQMKRLLNAPSSIPPPPPENMLSYVSWLEGDQQLIQLVKDRAKLIAFNYGDVIMNVGDKCNGIYIIVSGLVRLEGVSGHSPVLKADVSRMSMESDPQAHAFMDFLTAGKVIGEMSILTKEPRNATVTCETAVQCYYIHIDDCLLALQMFQDEPSLENRLWMTVAKRISATVMNNDKNYAGWSKAKIKMYLQDAFVPCVSQVTTFLFDYAATKEIFLIQGFATEYPQKNDIAGPIMVSRACTKLVLNHDLKPKVVLLVVPNEGIGPAITQTQLGKVLDSKGSLTSLGKTWSKHRKTSETVKFIRRGSAIEKTESKVHGKLKATKADVN